MERLTSARPWSDAQNDLSNEPGYSYIWQKLQRYEDTGLEPEELAQAEKEGRLVVLPCEIGSPVYSHARKLDGADYVRETEFWWSDIPQMGKTVFLTREAAEAALKEREAEYDR